MSILKKRSRAWHGATEDQLTAQILITESTTIMDYICDHFGPHLIPQRYPGGKEGQLGAENESWMRHRFLMDYTEGSLFTILVIALITGNVRLVPVPPFLESVTKAVADTIDDLYTNAELTNHLSFLESYLEKSPGQNFCSDSLTAADIMVHFALEASINRNAVTETVYPTLYKYVRRLQESDSYKRSGQRVEEASGEKFVSFSEAW